MADVEALGAHRLRLDIANEETVQSAVREIIETYNGVDVLVNNAGFGCYGAVEDTPIDDARYQFEVNLFGLARLTQLSFPGDHRTSYGRRSDRSAYRASPFLGYVKRDRD